MNVSVKGLKFTGVIFAVVVLLLWLYQGTCSLPWPARCYILPFWSGYTLQLSPFCSGSRYFFKKVCLSCLWQCILAPAMVYFEDIVRFCINEIMYHKLNGHFCRHCWGFTVISFWQLVPMAVNAYRNIPWRTGAQIAFFFFFFGLTFKILQNLNNSYSWTVDIKFWSYNLPFRPFSVLPDIDYNDDYSCYVCCSVTYTRTDTYSVFPFLPRSPSAGRRSLQAGALSKGRNKRVRSGWQVCENVQQLPAGFSCQTPEAMSCTQQALWIISTVYLKKKKKTLFFF